MAPNYYEHIISEFETDPQLGIAGGAVYTKVGRKLVTCDQTVDSVGGAVQLFRRECFEQLGGYMRLECGGIDAAAEIQARMNGWKVRKFPANIVFEQRRTGSASRTFLTCKYNEGLRFHSLGYSTLFYICRTVYRVRDKPLFFGSSVALFGFLHAKFKRYPLCLPPRVVSYLRREQITKLKRKILRHG